ncbi:hypothetical protein CL630_01450 [bacterium]|nr:hypothetical protein [bacterium]
MEYFEEEVAKLLEREGSKKDIALYCIIEVCRGYDSGGHSCGRSLRSGILEKVFSWLTDGYEEKAKCGLSILLAMYYDYEYINESGWFGHESGHKIESVAESPLRDRIHLSAAAFSLGLDEIPDIADWERDKIIEFLYSDHYCGDEAARLINGRG